MELSKIAIGLGSLLAIFASIIVGWKKLGESEAEKREYVRKYKAAVGAVERITKPIPGSDAVRLAARYKLRRMREDR